MLWWHFFAPAMSASMVITPSLSSWYFIFRCIVEGTAPSVAKVGRPSIQLYGD
ncbi:hypothetical protein A2U01_0035837 [Trifolium medium]|uniref:Uncharacterized protein n=1 Tax=Trifolium medium TaxID=97028 RepID=A0A392PUV6_9FABA|nr:hypothetical protein [Trifolium medium]